MKMNVCAVCVRTWMRPMGLAFLYWFVNCLGRDGLNVLPPYEVLFSLLKL